MLNRYIIERDIPGVDEMSTSELCGAARASNQAIAELSPQIQWEHSYVVEGKTFCVYLAESEAVIREHAKLSGIPANNVHLVKQVIDPLTANLA